VFGKNRHVTNNQRCWLCIGIGIVVTVAVAWVAMLAANPTRWDKLAVWPKEYPSPTGNT
jgi:hypothetical protein